MKYVLVGSGQFSEKSKFKEYAKDCKLIACDGGIDHCRKDNIVPDIMVGDFDLLLMKIICILKPNPYLFPYRSYLCELETLFLQLPYF